MGRAATICPSCGSNPWVVHSGLRWTLGKVGKWQWFDDDIQAWRWYEDGTLSSDLGEVPQKLRTRAIKPSKKVDRS